MTYSPTYVTGDISSMVVDLLGNGLFQVIGFVGLIVLVFLIGWIVKLTRHTVKGATA